MSTPAPFTPAQFNAARRFLPTSQGEIAYVEQGSGPAALFVHGIPMNGYHWRHALAALGTRRRCIAPDLMGMGHTRIGPDQDVSFRAQVSMLAELLDRLGVDKVDLVGNDSGGAICQMLAAAMPGRVRSLVLTNCDVHDNWPPPAFAQVMMLATFARLGAALHDVLENLALARSDFGLGVGFEHPARAVTPELVQAYIAPLVATPEASANFERFITALDNEQTTAIEAGLRRLQAPTLIVWGDADVFFPVRWAHWLREAIPGTRRLEVLAGARLFLCEEQPERFAGLVREHWDAVAA